MCSGGVSTAQVVESVGAGVESVVVGDHVVPCYTPQVCQPYANDHYIWVMIEANNGRVATDPNHCSSYYS